MPTAGTEITVSVQITTAFGCGYRGARTFVTRSSAEAKRLELWCRTRVQAVQMLNRYVARVKAVPPAPGVWMEAPTAESLAGLQKAVDQLATMLRNLGQQPPK